MHLRRKRLCFLPLPMQDFMNGCFFYFFLHQFTEAQLHKGASGTLLESCCMLVYSCVSAFRLICAFYLTLRKPYVNYQPNFSKKFQTG